MEEDEEMEEKSVQKSLIGIIYQATPHLSQWAHVSMWQSRVPNEKLGVSEQLHVQ